MLKLKTKAKWVKALRSGKFKQGNCILKDGDRFCCLGVLHEVTVGTWNKKYGTYYTGSRPRKNSNSKLLEGPFLQGLDYYEARKLAEMNDAGDSFDMIADYIEKKIEAK